MGWLTKNKVGAGGPHPYPPNGYKCGLGFNFLPTLYSSGLLNWSKSIPTYVNSNLLMLLSLVEFPNNCKEMFSVCHVSL